MDKKFTSNALWPESVRLGIVPNVSTDTHDTEEAAQAVCEALEKKGLGGNGLIFPIRTWVVGKGAKIEAMWTVKLNCECPACGDYIDLLDYADFWDGRHGLEIAHHGEITEVVCPECGHEFDVDAQY